MLTGNRGGHKIAKGQDFKIEGNFASNLSD
jgi:hypothetical protein